MRLWKLSEEDLDRLKIASTRLVQPRGSVRGRPKGVRDSKPRKARRKRLGWLPYFPDCGLVAEHRFCERRWRFDLAHLETKIAVEVEGGIWVQGRHIRPAGFINDIQKYNRATQLGWRVLRFTPQQVRHGAAKKFVLSTIEIYSQKTVENG